MAKSSQDSFASPPLNMQVKRGMVQKKCQITIALILAAVIAATCHWKRSANIPEQLHQQSVQVEVCYQPPPLVPTTHLEIWDTLNTVFATDVFKTRAIHWLGGAVRIPTESFDDLGPVGEDARWEVFLPFHNYISGAYPRVHSTLQLTKVNTYGLIYVWHGRDPLLKPILLTAHQDVVPVDPSSVGQWKYPPFSGHFDGEKIWGRGSSDDKSGLIGILSSVESLIEQGFQPTRTVVLAFGFDEEATGRMGAGELAKVLLAMFGRDGIAVLVDEGGGIVEQYGSDLALLGVAEKGYLDVFVEVTAPGGHSSHPPKHTSIGMLAKLLVELEENPFEVHLTREDLLFTSLQCIAEHTKGVPKELRDLIKRAFYSDEALFVLESKLFKEPSYFNIVGTTQAIDLIHGGVKANALPERAGALVNHRISALSSVSETRHRVTKLLKPLAEKFNLTLNAFGHIVSDLGTPLSGGALSLIDAYDSALEPAPITPTNKDSGPYRLLSGTIRATYNSKKSLSKHDNIVVIPSMDTGNTDTQFYWNLTRHIYRYKHGAPSTSNGDNNIHTVNEYMEVDSFLEVIRFFTTLILNANEASVL